MGHPSGSPSVRRLLAAFAWAALAGCQTPERQAVRDRLDRLQAENSALKAKAEAESAQTRMEVARQHQEDLGVIESLNARMEELGRKIEALSAAPRPAEAKPPLEPAKPDPERKAELERSKAEARAQMQRLEDELAKAQAQAEAARLAAEAVEKRPQEAKKEGSWKGQKLPLAKFVDASGKLADLGQYASKQPVVLVIMKGFYSQGVCVYCTRQTADLAKQIQAFRDLNAEVLVVYPGPEEKINVFVRSVRDYEKSGDPRFKLPFRVLLDVNQDAVRALRIDGDLAHPTSFVLDKDGLVRYQYTGRTLSDRPKAEDLLEVLRKFGGVKP